MTHFLSYTGEKNIMMTREEFLDLRPGDLILLNFPKWEQKDLLLKGYKLTNKTWQVFELYSVYTPKNLLMEENRLCYYYLGSELRKYLTKIG